MPRIIRSPASAEDLRAIAAFVALRNPSAADRLLDEFDRKLRMLAANPLTGRPRDELRARVRSYPVGSYVIFYRPIEDGIELIRVLHGARSLPWLFRDLGKTR